MSLSTLTPQTRTADFKIGTGVSYKTVVATFNFDVATEQINTSTVGTDAIGDFEPGDTIGVITVAGIIKKGTAVAGPLIPPPQNVVIVGQWDVSCTITATANFRRATIGFTTGQVSPFAGEAVTRSEIAVDWDLGS